MAEVGRDIDKASRILRAGGLVAIPTETVYGLAANALSPESVANIFLVKQRPSFDPLIVHFSESAAITDFVQDVPENAGKLMEYFWPGPLTLVLRKKSAIPDLVTSGLETVGCRVPNHTLTQKLLNKLPFPIAAPSANLFGRVSPTTPDHVNDQLGDSIDYILDGGKCTVGLESTIVGWEDEEPTIFRMGGIAVEDIEKIVGSVKVRTHSTSNPVAPGMLTNHYAPAVQMILGEIPASMRKDQTVGALRYSSYDEAVPNSRQVRLSASGDLNEAARNLFTCIRKLDTLDLSRVYVQEVPEIDLGRAINDRLRRATSVIDKV